MEQHDRSVVEDTCRIAEEFIKHFYERLDKRRYLLEKMYMESGVLVWNGNGTSGREAIGAFIKELPPSEHQVITLDAQRVLGIAVPDKIAYLIKAAGCVKYDGKLPRNYIETFMITNEVGKWKIVSDSFRFQEPIPG